MDKIKMFSHKQKLWEVLPTLKNLLRKKKKKNPERKGDQKRNDKKTIITL